jgi:branched-chain amino acid aminotransferase/para-aminobenzoate synthetase component 1
MMAMEEYVWLNDELTPREQAVVSVDDRGLQYGDGLFETLRAEGGRPLFLAAHLLRLRASAQALRLLFPEYFPWEERLGELLAANGLTEGLARVKILLTRGTAAGLGLPAAARPTLVIWAGRYEPPPPEEYAGGWPVAVFPERRTTFLGRHKSLNYLYYLAARQYALDQGAKEAIVLEADGAVSEGAATSLVYLHKGKLWTPAAASALPGVTVGMLALGLARLKLPLKEARTPLSRLSTADGVWLANSLLGLMPVAAINGKPIPLSGHTEMLQQALWSLA